MPTNSINQDIKGQFDRVTASYITLGFCTERSFQFN